jgi:magnesium-transporting ATPase (P-type)
MHGEHSRALILQFLAKFKNPLVVILLTASALSAFTGDGTSFFIIGTRKNSFKSHPTPWLIACSLMVVAVEGMKRLFFRRFA